MQTPGDIRSDLREDAPAARPVHIVDVRSGGTLAKCTCGWFSISTNRDWVAKGVLRHSMEIKV